MQHLSLKNECTERSTQLRNQVAWPMKGHHPRKQLQNLGEIHSWETLSVLYINCLAPTFKRVEIRNLSQLKAELKLRTCLI